MMASPIPQLEWPPPAPAPQEQDHCPNPSQWWPMTPRSTGEGRLLNQTSVMSPLFSPFSAYANYRTTPGTTPSPFLQPFPKSPQPQHQYHHHHHHNNQEQQQHYQQSNGQLQPPQLSPFATHQLSPSLIFPQPGTSFFSTTPQLSPAPTTSARSNPQFLFSHPIGQGRGFSFLKLPAEVRAAIYQYLVPQDLDLHIAMDPIHSTPSPLNMDAHHSMDTHLPAHPPTPPPTGKMYSYTCQDMGDAEYVGRYWFAMSENEYRKLGTVARESGHLACVRVGGRIRELGRDGRGWGGLLGACRAIHEEFTPYLYGRPKLHFDDAATLRRFLETADCERLRNYLRNISISYLVPESHPHPPSPTMAMDFDSHYSQASLRQATQLEDWTRAWQGIALLDGLKHLRVTMIARGVFANPNREYETSVLKPMMLLHGRKKGEGGGGRLEDFEVVCYQGVRNRGLPSSLLGVGGEEASPPGVHGEHRMGGGKVPFSYLWKAWAGLAGPELERIARRQKQFVDVQAPYWHHLSRYKQPGFYKGDLSMRSFYSFM